MIVAVVRFKLPESVSLEDATALYEKSAPNYKGLPGLKRKHYLFGEGAGGGVYFWNSLEEAKQLYSDAWKAGIRERFGSDPEIAYYSSPVSVINE